MRKQVAFEMIDHDQRKLDAVVLAGTGEAVTDTIELDGFDLFTPRGYDKILREGRKVLSNILDIEVPMIAALNGPAFLHSEYDLLTDIILATPQTVSRTSRTRGIWLGFLKV